MQLNWVLFFSLDSNQEERFLQQIKDERSTYDASFRNVKHHPFFHASDLFYFLEYFKQHAALSSLYVIIDYLSFLKYEEKGKRFDTFSYSADVIRRAILMYPEVYFLFAETATGFDFSDFLFDEAEVISRMKNKDCDGDLLTLYKQYHQFHFEAENRFDFISRGRSNLFDGSNLRYLIKRYTYQKLEVNKMNFEKTQNSRRDHLALCVEEEVSQARFNGYVLHSCGFRVLPVASASELKIVNETLNVERDKVIVVRDFDLQFPDTKKENFSDVTPEEGLNLVDYVRGAKRFDEDDQEEGKKIPENYKVGDWRVPDNNPFWNNLIKLPQYFVSKGKNGIRFCQTEKDRCRFKKKYAIQEEKNIFIDKPVKQYQVLLGITKPVVGIYYSILNFKEVGERFLGGEWEKKKYVTRDTAAFDTRRTGHSHGVPLDIYNLVKGMIDRAEHYYKEEKFLLAAVVSGEAIEVLNGFHESLMLKAYHIHAVSENALAMNLIGGDEYSLRLDAQFRIEMIKDDVKRMLKRDSDQNDDEGDRGLFEINILNQIFSDCRQYCKKREHFDSEEAFVGAMGHINDGENICDGLRHVKDSINIFLKKGKKGKQ